MKNIDLENNITSLTAFILLLIANITTSFNLSIFDEVSLDNVCYFYSKLVQLTFFFSENLNTISILQLLPQPRWTTLTFSNTILL